MKLLQIIILFFLSFQAFGQKVTYNHIVDTADIETKKVMMLFENYLDSSPQNKGKNEFCNIKEQQKHKNYDFLESEFQPSLYMGFPVHVLSIKFRNNIMIVPSLSFYSK